MDVYAPTRAGPWPIVVVVPGGGVPPDQVMGYTDDFALALADRGAVVMTTNWRQTLAFGSDPVADVICAIGVARATGPDYGADPSRLVLVGHSSSVLPVSLAGLRESPISPAADSCDRTSGPLRPDAMAVIAGLFVPEALDLAASDPPGAHIPVVIAQGGADDHARVAAARSFQALLTANGWQSTLVEAPAATHFYILYDAATLDAIMGLTSRP
jgi:hypothetical protein